MKILLIYPYFIEDRIHQEEIQALPMGLYSVGAVLKEHQYDVKILNWHDKNEQSDIIEHTLREMKPDIIGFSILHANRWGGIEIARKAKKLFPGAPIVFGGVGATFLWDHLLHYFPEIDYIVRGEGEYTFLNLIRALESGEHQAWEGLPGIAYRTNGVPFKTIDAEPIADLDALPLPAQYFEYHHVAASRGCPWSCTFCGSPALWRRNVRYKSPARFVEELELLYRKGITFFHVSDDTFTLRKERVIEICQRIIEQGLAITWYAISRVDAIDEEILMWMRKAGCIQISYGVESGSPQIRKVFNKTIATTQIKRAFSLTTSHGILSRAYFIYGAPYETQETIQETIDLITEIKPLSVIYYILDLYPGTGLYTLLKERAHLSDDVWLNKIEGILYHEIDPTLTAEMVLSFGEQLRTSFYQQVAAFARSIRLVKTPELFPLHADFLSRLGMTFSHGDYASRPEIPEKEEIAEELYLRSLEYAPNHRAYLGLGILKQKKGDYASSILILSNGIAAFPQSESLHLCIGVSYMNMQQYHKALSHFSRFPHSPEAASHMEVCYRALGR